MAERFSDEWLDALDSAYGTPHPDDVADLVAEYKRLRDKLVAMRYRVDDLWKAGKIDGAAHFLIDGYIRDVAGTDA